MLKASDNKSKSRPSRRGIWASSSALIVKGELTGKLAKEVLAKMFESGEPPSVDRGARRPEADQRYRRSGEDRR